MLISITLNPKTRKGNPLTDLLLFFYLRLAKGVINFHGQHKDDVKKWLRYCERKLNEINSDADEINSVYDEYCKLQVTRLRNRPNIA